MGTLRKMWVVLIYTGLVVCVAQAAEINLPEDTSALLVAKELRISGNTLISTEHLLEYMPDIYNASDQRLSEAAPEHLYDLRVIRQIIAEPGIPRQVSIRTIQGLTQYILSMYKEADYSGIYVYVPEGAIRNGITLVNQVLPINIIEAPVSEVRIKYYDAERNEIEEGFLKRSALEKWSPVKRDKVAGQRSLDYLVNLLNLNPDRHVSAIVSRGEEPNSLAIQYDVYETRPWHFFAQVDNSGTNDREWAPKFGVINTNLTGIDDRFTALYQVSADSNFDDNYSVFGSYDFPVTGPRLRLNVFGGYSEFDIDPEGGPIDFIGNGSFYGAVLRYNILQRRGWFLDATGSLSHEESKITPSLFPQFFASDVKMNLWGIGANAHRRDDTSSTAVTLNYSENFGGSDQDEFWDSATLTGARTNAERDFSIITLAGNHSQYLDQDKVQQLRSTAKWIEPTERLVPAKMTSFGGMYTIRGYDEYEIVADGGILASIQYEYDLVRHSQAVESETVAGEELKKLAPLVFFDYGRTKIESPVPGETDNQKLYSVGVGLAFEIGDNFSGAVYYGHPLKDTVDTDSGNGRISASVMLRW
ncbi:MAG: ShlB/FhaC/HecB family hemolysin secretion/activation protein [candidate division Zixibacteria bacterium]|nr:ShlB/FhaC/HecB family hemolysin secretion/activation protein [candidate division Zixibacteria bacterium]